MPDVILEGKGLGKTFRNGFGGGACRALEQVDIRLEKGESLGLMGPSGCGKSTLARLLLRLMEPDEGQVLLRGKTLPAYAERISNPFAAVPSSFPNARSLSSTRAGP